VKFHSCRI